MAKCELCEGYGGHSTDMYDMYRIPAEWDTLCTDCAESVNTHTIDDMTDEEVIAAIIDDSLGYASPAHAAKHVREFKEGKHTAYCERGSACFPMSMERIEELDDVNPSFSHPGDLDRLMEAARKHWMMMSPQKQKSVLDFVEDWKDAEDGNGISGISMLYPTHGPA